MEPRTLKILLALSLLLNVFLGGAAAGGFFWLHARKPMIAAGTLRIAGDELPVDERRAFRGALREARWSMHPTVEAGRQARRDAAALLRQPNVDQNALLAALARVREADTALRAGIEQRAVTFVSTLPPADRARLADGLQRQAERRGGRRAQ